MRSGLIAGVSAYVMWGLLTIYWKNLHGFPPFELIGWRIFASFCMLAPLVILVIYYGVQPGPILDASAASVEQILKTYQAAASAVAKTAALVP